MQTVRTVFHSFNVGVDVLKGLKSLILNEWNIKKFDNCFIMQMEKFALICRLEEMYIALFAE